MFLCNARYRMVVAEHGDHVETIQKEMEQIAHYEDIKDVVSKHFSDYTDRTTLTE